MTSRYGLMISRYNSMISRHRIGRFLGKIWWFLGWIWSCVGTGWWFLGSIRWFSVRFDDFSGLFRDFSVQFDDFWVEFDDFSVRGLMISRYNLMISRYNLMISRYGLMISRYNSMISRHRIGRFIGRMIISQVACPKKHRCRSQTNFEWLQLENAQSNSRHEPFWLLSKGLHWLILLLTNIGVSMMPSHLRLETKEAWERTQKRHTHAHTECRNMSIENCWVSDQFISIRSNSNHGWLSGNEWGAPFGKSFGHLDANSCRGHSWCCEGDRCQRGPATSWPCSLQPALFRDGRCWNGFSFGAEDVGVASATHIPLRCNGWSAEWALCCECCFRTWFL